jgi:hypothetical protein
MILGQYIDRWNLEVTFAEGRTHLGLETQRHGSRRALGGVTPCLMGLFSVPVGVAKALPPEPLPLRKWAWYAKEEASFADVLAATRHDLWDRLTPRPIRNYAWSVAQGECYLIPGSLWRQLQQVVCYTS